MNQIIAMLLPSAFGTLVYVSNKESKTSVEVLIYLINVFLTNIICYLFLYDVFGLKKLNFTNIFAIKYGLAAALISIIIGIIETLISKSVKLKVEVKKNDKETKKERKKSTKNNR